MLILQELSGKQKRVLTLSSVAVLTVIVVMLYIYLQPHQYPKELSAIDTLSESRPDSALKLLKRLPERSLDSDADHMYYALLKIKTANNLYEPQKDSTIFRVCDFFEDFGDKDKYRESCYYLGKYYVEHSDAPQALKCFQTALDLCDDKTPLSFKSKVYNQCGGLFLDQNMFDDALTMYRESFVCDSVLNDTVNIVNSMRDIAQVYKFLNRLNECETVLLNAYRLSVKLNSQELKNSVAVVLTSIYLKENELNKSKIFLRDLLKSKDKNILSPAYCAVIDIYDKEGKIDSVYFYCNKLMAMGTIYAKEYASRKLTKYFALHSDYGNTLYYLNLHKCLSDSVQELSVTKNLAIVHSLYNYKNKEREIYNLKLELTERSVSVLTVFSVFILLVGFFLFMYERYKKKSVEYERLNEHLAEKCNTIKKEKDLRISELQSALEDALNHTEYIIDEGINSRKLYVYDIISNRINKKQNVSVNDWKEVEIAIDEIYPKFKERLYSYSVVSPREYRICILIKLGFSLSDIATIICRSRSSITQIRSALYKKVLKEDGKGKDFDDFIKSL